MPQPFFTIGVTTYNRRELLKQTLASILAQTFSDFEVIVGNDYTDEVLSGGLFGISDPRIRFVNHPRNLQEVGNMNALLAMASGRYFTWLADDDLYDPGFLRMAHELLEKTGYPPGFFSSYRIFRGTDPPKSEEIPRGSIRVLSGRDFLGGYVAGTLKIISVYGLFDTGKLRSVVGGIEGLCASSVGLHAEYFFLIRCALLERIAYLDSPFVLFRAHAGSWGGTNMELDKYREAGTELIRRSGEVLRDPSLSGDLSKHLLTICGIHMHQYAGKLGITNVSQGKYGAAAMLTAMSSFSAEVARVRRLYVEAGGADGLHDMLGFAWFRCKYGLLIVGIIAANWLKGSRV